MKWLKKHKNEIVFAVQIALIVLMLLNGFWFTYLQVCFGIGLPIEWYSVVATLVLAALSVLGLFAWVVKTNEEA